MFVVGFDSDVLYLIAFTEFSFEKLYLPGLSMGPYIQEYNFLTLYPAE
jgi:hypothetical protein